MSLRDSSEAKAAKSAPPEGISSATKNAVITVLMLGMMIFTIKSIPALRASFAPLDPISNGVVPSDDETKACIVLLWKAARALQDKGDLVEFPHCPVGASPYRVVESGKYRVIQCPNPYDHGVSDISVSDRNPIPRVTE